MGEDGWIQKHVYNLGNFAPSFCDDLSANGAKSCGEKRKKLNFSTSYVSFPDVAFTFNPPVICSNSLAVMFIFPSRPNGL
jgi:hypothetical protein